jgi:hypothetical protein
MPTGAVSVLRVLPSRREYRCWAEVAGGDGVGRVPWLVKGAKQYVEDPREVDAIKVDLGEDIRIRRY